MTKVSKSPDVVIIKRPGAAARAREALHIRAAGLVRKLGSYQGTLEETLIQVLVRDPEIMQTLEHLVGVLELEMEQVQLERQQAVVES